MPDNTKINQSLVIGVFQIAEVNLTRCSDVQSSRPMKCGLEQVLNSLF